MSDRQDPWVPTPEEIETGTVHRRKFGKGAPESEAEREIPGRFTLLRRIGVGRKRKYVKVDRRSRPRQEAPPPHIREATPLRGEDEPPAEVTPVPPGSVSTEEAHPERRVESVVLPTRARRLEPETPPTPPRTREEIQFRAKAAEKGHQMGPMTFTAGTDSLEATCLLCGEVGEIVVERDDNFANSTNATNHHYRGKAINRTCVGGGDAAGD